MNTPHLFHSIDELVDDLVDEREHGRVGICQGCGCTELEACTTQDGTPCAWVDGNEDLCTACVERSELLYLQAARMPAVRL